MFWNRAARSDMMTHDKQGVYVSSDRKFWGLWQVPTDVDGSFMEIADEDVNLPQNVMATIEYLKLRQTKVNGDFLRRMPVKNRVKFIDLGETLFQSEHVKDLLKLKSLNVVILDGAHLQAADVLELCLLKKLQTLLLTSKLFSSEDRMVIDQKFGEQRMIWM